MKKTYQQPEIRTTAFVDHHYLLSGSTTTITVDKSEEMEENYSRQSHSSLWDEYENEY